MRGPHKIDERITAAAPEGVRERVDGIERRLADFSGLFIGMNRQQDDRVRLANLGIGLYVLWAYLS